MTKTIPVLILALAWTPGSALTQNRPLDPWVFRSVLDEQPRIATVALAEHLYIAYDASTGGLYKAWDGGVNFDGAVYTTMRGPQPTSSGPEYFTDRRSTWQFVNHGRAMAARGHYRGHSFRDGRVTFRYELQSGDGESAIIEESPEFLAGQNSATVGLERRFKIVDAPPGVEIKLDLHVDSMAGSETYDVSDGEFTVADATEDSIEGTLTLSRSGETRFVVWLKRVEEAESVGDVPPVDVPEGLMLIEQSDCRICHAPKDRTVGPSWSEISERYDSSESVVVRLAAKVIEGGSGEWGTAVMIPHPTLSDEEAEKMVRYILSLDEGEEQAMDSPDSEPATNDNVEATTTIAMTLVGPVIDGEVDEVWQNADPISIARPAVSGSTELILEAPTVRLLYDAIYLYALFEVEDDIRINDSDDPYYDDAVEVYLDGGFEREEYYDENDVQYTFPTDGGRVWINGDRSRHVGLEHVSAETDTGYIVELKIPMANVDIVPAPGLQFGIQFHVDDDDVGGSNATALSWSTNEPVSWYNTSVFGTAILGDAGDQPLLAALERSPGLRLQVFDLQKSLTNLLRLAPGQLPNAARVISELNLQSAEDFGGFEDQFLAEVDGFLQVEVEGDYVIRLISDDGARLWLDNQLLIDHDGSHAAEAKDATVTLSRGAHTLRVRHFDGRGGQQLTLLWQKPGNKEFEVIPSGVLSRRAHASLATAPGIKYVIEPPVVLRPGDTVELESVHPAYDLATIRPEAFQPRVGGMDFLSDGRLVICTWDAEGAVYLLDNVQEGAGEAVGVKKIGSGLAEPLGLKVVDDQIFVLQKQELTQLIDHDGDDVIDEYRTVANGWGVTSNFHEFAFGLVYKDEHFYATLATAIEPGGASSSPQNPDRGKVIKIARDGSHEFIAHGLRTPNGIGIGVDDEIFVTDNQGDWLPSSKLLHVRDGAFFGNRSVDPEGTAGLIDSPPVVWMPQDEIGNSPSQPIEMKHGPYEGQMLYGEVTHGGLKRVFLEKVGGEYQGALFRFTQGLEAGINRVVRGPNGSIYVGGVGSAGNWGQTGKKKFGLQRLDYNGDVPFEMLAVRAKSNGLEIEFTKPLPGEAGGDARDYNVAQWKYVPTSQYGGPKVDEHHLEISSASVSEDRRRVFLEISEMKPGYVVYVHLVGPFASEAGERVWTTEAWYTMNSIPDDVSGVVTASPRPVNALSKEEEADGFELLFDGRTTESWSGYRGNTIPEKWVVRDGALTFDPSREGDGGDIATRALYGDFELRLEWKVSEGGNSGIFYRVDSSLGSPWESGPEMQVLDNSKHADGRNPLTSAGANYAIDAPIFDATRPVGEWNTVRLIARGNHVEHWLNGYKVVDYTLWDEGWERKVQSSKFSEMPEYGRRSRGHIVLQDHGDAVRYRNIRIKVLED